MAGVAQRSQAEDLELLDDFALESKAEAKDPGLISKPDRRRKTVGGS